MSAETRIRYLLQAATRAEEEGDVRVARLYRRMAEEARPAAEAGPVMIGVEAIA